MKSCIVVVCVLVLCTVQTAWSIKCYMCLSGDDGPDCESSNITVLARFKTDCEPLSGTSAVKYNTVNRCAKTIHNGQLTRACYFVDPNVRDNACTTGNGATACLCWGDYCNAASRPTVSKIFLSTLTALFVSLTAITNFI